MTAMTAASGCLQDKEKRKDKRSIKDWNQIEWEIVLIFVQCSFVYLSYHIYIIVTVDEATIVR